MRPTERTSEDVWRAHWRRDRAAEGLGAPGTLGSADHGANPMRIVYRVDGSSDLTEETLGHLDGWRGSRLVRLGSGAADQLQLDVKYLMFDLEATRRERDEFRQQLEELLE